MRPRPCTGWDRTTTRQGVSERVGRGPPRLARLCAVEGEGCDAARARRSRARATQPASGLGGVVGGMQPTTVEELFRHEYTRLVRALGVAFGDDVAADAVQEAFIEADRRWRRVAALDDPAGWVRRVALNRLLTHRRLQRRREEILATVRPAAPDDLTDECLDLRRAIDALAPRMRLVVCLHYLGGLSVAEVADALTVSAGTVKSTLHDARGRLRRELEAQHG